MKNYKTYLIHVFKNPLKYLWLFFVYAFTVIVISYCTTSGAENIGGSIILCLIVLASSIAASFQSYGEWKKS